MSRGGYDTGLATRTARDAGIIARTIERIDNRAMADDATTLQAATLAELRKIYLAAKRRQRRHRSY